MTEVCNPTTAQLKG